MTDTPPSNLCVHIERRSDIVLVRLSGSLGAADAPGLTETLADHALGEGARLGIDLSGLTALDSSGLSALIQTVTRARMTGGRVVLIAPSTFVSGVLTVTRLDTWFDLCDTLDEALLRLDQQ